MPRYIETEHNGSQVEIYLAMLWHNFMINKGQKLKIGHSGLKQVDKGQNTTLKGSVIAVVIKSNELVCCQIFMFLFPNNTATQFRQKLNLQLVQ